MRVGEMQLIMNVNLLVIRYVIIRLGVNDLTTEGIILQLPWWDLETALKRGRFWRTT